MSANSSVTFNSSLDSAFSDCFDIAYFYIMVSTYYAFKSVLLSSLCTLILCLAQQHWRPRRSFTAASHSDIFTYHLAFMELLGIFGTAFLLSGNFSETKEMQLAGLFIMSFPDGGEILIHTLCCMERYLAVVHPHTYMGLKNARGIRLRNILIGCVWVFCFIWAGTTFSAAVRKSLQLCVMALCIAVISVCSVSVLCALIRPGPGEQGHGKDEVNLSKKKAFFTITAIVGTHWLWFIPSFVVFGSDNFNPQGLYLKCVALSSISWFYLPSSLVLPVLYLQRAGKLTFCLQRDCG